MEIWGFSHVYEQHHNERPGLNENNTCNSETEESVVYLTVTRSLLIYVPPFFIAIGTISSILSMLVLLRRTMRHNPAMFYLTVLSFFDIAVLNIGLLRHWIQVTFEVNIRDFSEFSCRFHAFLTYFTLDYSAWILVALTINTCISVCMPLKGRIYCTLNRSKLSVVVIAIILVFINGHLFFTVGIINNSCDEIDSFVSYYWPYIDFVVFCFLPFIIMAVCNILIIRALTKALNKFQPDSKNNSSLEIASRRQNRKYNVIAMSLSLNVVFFLCTFPISLYFIFEPFYHDQYPNLMGLLETISTLLMYFRNAIHFPAYCISGTKFRNEFIKMFKIKVKKPTDQSVFYS